MRTLSNIEALLHPNKISDKLAEQYRNDSDSFKNMYGKDSEFINPTNMMQVAKTMNEKFLSK